MKATELWRLVAAGGVDAAEAKRRVEALASFVRGGLAGGRFDLKDFGSLVARRKEARAGRNPMTGESIEISARTVVAFKPAPALKRAVSGSGEAAPKIADAGVKATFDVLLAGLLGPEGEGGVKVPGVGVFRRVTRPERQGRNPRTGEAITIASSSSVAFRADASLPDVVSAPLSDDAGDAADSDDADESAADDPADESS